MKNKRLNKIFYKELHSRGFRILIHLKILNYKIANTITISKLKFRKILFKFGYVMLIGIITLLFILDCTIYYFFHINYFAKIFTVIFLSKNSPEWISGLGTFMVAILAVSKLFEKSKPGLRTHVDKDHVGVEIIGNSNTSGFALLKHIYIVNKDLSKQFPKDFECYYKNSEYSEAFSNNKKAVIYLKRNKNDNRLKPIVNLARSFENSPDVHMRDCHYIDVYFSINDHILPVSLQHVINVDDLKDEHWHDNK